MKIYCITDNKEMEVGLKLAGCEGITLEDEEEISKKIDEIVENKEYEILVLTKNIYNLQKEKVDNIRLNKKLPLVSVI